MPATDTQRRSSGHRNVIISITALAGFQSFRRLPGVNTAGSDGPEREEGHSSSAMLSAMRAAAHVAGHSHAVAKKRLEERIVRANTLLT